jgi:hypothetical protein
MGSLFLRDRRVYAIAAARRTPATIAKLINIDISLSFPLFPHAESQFSVSRISGDAAQDDSTLV